MAGRADGPHPVPVYSCQGNSFILVTEADTAHVPSMVRDMRTDGLLIVEESGWADVRIRLFEKDGSESDLCGNGVLCVAYHLSRARRKREWKIEMGGRVHLTAVRGSRVTAVFGRLQDPMKYIGPAASFVQRSDRLLSLTHRGNTLYFVNSGEPHLFLLAPDPDALDIDIRAYQGLLDDRGVFPKGVNFDVLTTCPPFRIRTFERGVNAFTGSCGTGSMAAAQLLDLLGNACRGGFSFRSMGGVHDVSLDGDQVHLSGRVKTGGRCALTPEGKLTSGSTRSSAFRKAR